MKDKLSWIEKEAKKMGLSLPLTERQRLYLQLSSYGRRDDGVDITPSFLFSALPASYRK